MPGAEGAGSPPTPWIPARARSALAAAAALYLAGAAFVAMVWIPYKGYPEASKVVELPRGRTVRALARILKTEGVIASELAFRTLVWLQGPAATLKAGEYEFRGSQSLAQVAHQISEGRVVQHQITIPEGLTVREVAELLSSQGLGDEAEVLQAARSVGWVAGWDAAATDLEGYLFPDTYRLARGMSAEDLLHPMVERFGTVLTEPWRARAKELGLTVRQVVTLASLIEKETGAPDERPLISAVFHNRLRRRMPLQCDPTVIYALARENRYRGSLSRQDLRFDSPYNTYVYPSLPPGPIASPGRASLEAALYPADADYLYFVSMNTGHHYFSRQLAEHEQAVRRYQR